jgi:hypothetical protein
MYLSQKLSFQSGKANYSFAGVLGKVIKIAFLKYKNILK